MFQGNAFQSNAFQMPIPAIVTKIIKVLFRLFIPEAFASLATANMSVSLQESINTAELKAAKMNSSTQEASLIASLEDSKDV